MAASLFATQTGLAQAVQKPNTTTTKSTQATSGQPSSTVDNSGKSGLVPCGNTVDKPCTVEDIFNVFVIITNYLIGIAGLIAIISIVYAGFSMVMAAGRTEAIASGKKRLTNSVIGLILIMLAFVIINAILYGTLGLGVFGGQSILSNPADYINGTTSQ